MRIIDGDALLDRIPNLYERHEVARWVDEAPTIEPEQRWIPCKEKLPEYRDWYLGVFRECDTGWINPIPFICDYVGRDTKITTKDFWILKHIDGDTSGLIYYKNLECVAWMPLPEPWEGEEDG